MTCLRNRNHTYLMKSVLLISSILLTSCAAVSPQVGYREARGYEASTGYQTGLGVRGEIDAGPVVLEGSAMRWGQTTDQGGEMFVNRSTDHIRSTSVQLSAGARVPIAEGLSIGAGLAFSHSTVSVDLDYVNDGYRDHAQEWTGYCEARYSRNAWFIAARLDEPLSDGQSAFTTEPGSRGVSLLAGLNFAF